MEPLHATSAADGSLAAGFPKGNDLEDSNLEEGSLEEGNHEASHPEEISKNVFGKLESRERGENRCNPRSTGTR